MDKKALSAAFDDCLLNKLEMKRWERIMKSKRSAEAIQDKLDAAFEGKLLATILAVLISWRALSLSLTPPADGFEDWPEPTAMEADEHAGHNHAGHRH